MASSTSEQTTSPDGTAEQVDDSVAQNGSNQSEALAAAKRAVGTAAAAALAGALVGAGKALLDRRANSDGIDTGDTAEGEHSDEPVEAEASSAPSEDDAQSEPAEESESDEPPAETTGQGEGHEEDEDEADEDVSGDPAARREETDSDETADDTEDDANEHDQPQSGASSSNVAKIVERARSHAQDLLGEEPESVTGIDRSDGSWTVTLEVVELHRVPETTDVMGAYQLVLDDDGNLVRFDRTARYVRSQVEDVS